MTGITSIMRDWGVSPCIVRVTTTDNLAAITTAGYVPSQLPNIIAINFGAFEWAPGDLVAINYNGGENYFTYNAATGAFALDIAPPGALALTNSHIFVGNAANVATDVAMTGIVAISNTGATTIPLAASDILVGSAGNLAAPVAMTGDVTISDTGVALLSVGAVDSSNTNPNLIQLIEVNISDAQFNGMYAAPVAVLPAPGAGLVYVVNEMMLSQTFGTMAYAAGGVVQLQYGSVAHAAGNGATLQIAAGNITGMAVSSQVSAIGQMQTGANANQALTLSNDTAPFTTGDGTWKLYVWYTLVTI